MDTTTALPKQAVTKVLYEKIKDVTQSFTVERQNDMYESGISHDIFFSDPKKHFSRSTCMYFKYGQFHFLGQILFAKDGIFDDFEKKSPRFKRRLGHLRRKYKISKEKRLIYNEYVDDFQTLLFNMVFLPNVIDLIQEFGKHIEHEIPVTAGTTVGSKDYKIALLRRTDKFSRHATALRKLHILHFFWWIKASHSPSKN